MTESNSRGYSTSLTPEVLNDCRPETTVRTLHLGGFTLTQLVSSSLSLSVFSIRVKTTQGSDEEGPEIGELNTELW